MRLCFYCDQPMASPFLPSRPDTRTRDHLVPRRFRVAGGSYMTVDACRTCNEEKADLTLAEFRTVRGVERFPGEARHRGAVRRAERAVERAGFDRFYSKGSDK